MKGLGRIIDANINRICEGIRVIEDIFRFFYDDREISETLKNARHEIRKFVKNEYIDFRDSESDVGKEISVYHELERKNIEDIFVANLKRIEESSRVLEEFFKIENENKGKFFKDFRFKVYEIEKSFFSKKRKFKNLLNRETPVLYGIVDTRFSSLNHIDLTKELLDGGIKIIQFREKVLGDRDTLYIARKMKKLCEDYDAIFIVNDRVDIALLSNADGVHLGQNDIQLNDAKNLLGPNKIYGLSTHNIEQVEEAIELNPDYIGFGPIFETKSKENPDPVVGIEKLKEVKERFKINVVAIGGINLSNIKDVIYCKPEMICVMSGIISYDDVKNRVKKYMEIIDDTIKSC